MEVRSSGLYELVQEGEGLVRSITCSGLAVRSRSSKQTDFLLGVSQSLLTRVSNLNTPLLCFGETL